MRPADNSTAIAGVNARFWHWKSLLVYFFGCLALILGLITLGLLVFICSYRKSLSNSSPIEAEEKPSKSMEIAMLDSEPKIVVIMAGDENPTYLAKPASCNCHSEQV